MEKTTKYWALASGLLVIIFDLIFLRTSKAFFFLLGFGAFIAIFPFLINLIVESSKEKRKEEVFLDFVRDIAESVNTGLPISKSIINLSKKDYGILTQHVRKLSNQIGFGIPLKTAFRTFAKDADNRIIGRAVELIIQAELSGGKIDLILENVAKSISELQVLRKERQGRVYGLIVQGYVLFLIFIAIMLFVDLKFIPMIASTISTGEGIGVFGNISITTSTTVIRDAFFVLLLIQAFFAGLVTGKLSEGNIIAGLKHSIILLFITYLMVTAARSLFA